MRVLLVLIITIYSASAYGASDRIRFEDWKCFSEDPWGVDNNYNYDDELYGCMINAHEKRTDLPIWYIVLNSYRCGAFGGKSLLGRCPALLMLSEKGESGANAMLEVLASTEWKGRDLLLRGGGMVMEKVWGHIGMIKHIDERLKTVEICPSNLLALKIIAEQIPSFDKFDRNISRYNLPQIITQDEKGVHIQVSINRAVKALWGAQIGLSLPGGAKSSPAWKTCNEPEIIDYSMKKKAENRPFVVAAISLIVLAAAGAVAILVRRRRKQSHK